MHLRRSALASFLLLALVGVACSDDATVSGGADDGSSTSAETTAPGPVDVTAPSIDELLDAEGTLLVAHAGGDRDAPQETMYAFTLAAEAGSDVLELDVMLTADDELVVHHDQTVDRFTDGTGEVGELTLAEIQQLDAAYWWSPECTNGSCRDLPEEEYLYRGVRTGDRDAPEGFSAEDFRVPTFREVAEAFPDLPLDVEIKGDGEQGHPAVDVLADVLEELDRVDSTVVVSFESSTVERMRERLPEVETSPGLATMTDWVLDGEPLEGYRIVQIPPSYEGVDLLDLVLERARDAGIEVWVWPNDADAQENSDYYQQLIDAGIDGVIAGSPEAWPG